MTVLAAQPVWRLTRDAHTPAVLSTGQLLDYLSNLPWWVGPIGTRVEAALELGMPTIANELLAPHGIHVRRTHA